MQNAGRSKTVEKDWSGQQAIGVGFAVIIFAGFIVPVGATGAFTDWPHFLYDYQTLIGGMAAIVAAYITVQVMIATDKEADRRHREAMGLVREKEALILERAVTPQRGQLLKLEEQLKELREKIEPTLASIEAFRDTNERLFGQLHSILTRPQFVEGTALFGGALYRQVDSLRDCASKILDLDDNPLPLRRYTVEFGWVNHSPTDQIQEEKVRVASYFGLFDTIMTMVPSVVEGLDAIVERYRDQGAWVDN